MTGDSLLIVTHPVSKEIAKAQHGCIDCFAAMICVEVGTAGTECQPLATPANGEKKMRKLIEEIPEGGLRSRPKGSNSSHVYTKYGILLWFTQIVRISY